MFIRQIICRKILFSAILKYYCSDMRTNITYKGVCVSLNCWQ